MRNQGGNTRNHSGNTGNGGRNAGNQGGNPGNQVENVISTNPFVIDVMLPLIVKHATI